MITKTIKLLGIIMILILSGQYSYSLQQELAFQKYSDDIPLEKALNSIKQERKISFVYESSVVHNKYVNVQMFDFSSDIEVVLDNLLAPKGLLYEKLNENTYVIKSFRKEGPDDIEVSGKVISTKDQIGIPGVNVLIKGTSIGVVTDIDGNYSIDVPSENSVLVFSSVGFAKKEVEVGNQTTLNVELAPDVKQLSEIVVTAVGIEANKSELGYSIQNVDNDEIVRSRETNISSSLSGKIAGVQVISSSGSPGASADIRIRGSRSLNGSNQPLYVIDGVPIDNGTSANGTAGVDVSNRAIDINPNDIDQLTVLKGPAATVLYGSRAANGAIMITTKQGKKGKPVVTINSAFGVNRVNKLPERQNMYAQGRPISGLFAYRGPETAESASYGPLISELEFDGNPTYPYDKNGRLVPEGTGNGMPARAYDPYDIFVDGYSRDNNVSVGGGTEVVQYYISAGNLYQTGIVPNSDFERTSIKANFDAKLTEKFSIGVSSTFINSGGKRVQRGSNLSGVTTGIFRVTPSFDNGNGLSGHEAADTRSTYMFPDGKQRSYRGNGLYDNPYWTLNNNPYIDNVNRVLGNVNFTYEVFDWLKLKYKIGVDRFTDVRDIAWDINSSSENLGRVNQSVRTSNRVNSDFLVLISKSINEDLDLNATLGHNYFYDENLLQSSNGLEMAVQGFYDISNTSVIQANRSIRQEGFYGAFADLKLSYKNYLYLNLSGRNDWASSLPKKNNSFFYPAASVGFEFTEFLDMSNSAILPYGKIRASYGTVGSAPPVYRTNSDFSNAVIDGDGLLPSNQFPAFGVNGFERSGLAGNQDLRPEITTTYEVGADFKFFKGRLGLDGTYYNAFTKDAIVTTTLPAPSGFTSVTLNSGEVQNSGLEIVLSGTPVRSNDFEWYSQINFTRNRSIVKSISEDLNSISLASFSAISSLNIVGQPYGVFSGTRYRRNDAGQLVIGSDGWPLIDDTQGVIGDPNPDFLLGFSNNLSYKDFSFSFLWDIRKGGDLWNGTKGVMDYLGVSKESGDDRDVIGYVYDGVTEKGEVNTIPVDFANPALGLGGIKWRRAGTLLGLAEDNIEDGSWIRLREVTATYRLSSKIFANTRAISGASISAYGRNLLLFTEYKGVDPETNLRGPSNAQGWDYFNMPNTKSYGISLQVTIK